VAALLLIGLVGLLGLNTVLARSSFTVTELAADVASLEEQQAALAEEVAVLESPTELARRAAQLGMVPGGAPVFIDPATPQAPKP
jgi:cell division protein FtsB